MQAELTNELQSIYTALMVEYDRRIVLNQDASAILAISNKVLNLIINEND